MSANCSRLGVLLALCSTLGHSFMMYTAPQAQSAFLGSRCAPANTRSCPQTQMAILGFGKEKCFIEIGIQGKSAGILQFELFDSYTPKTVEIFKTLVSGELARGDSSMTYKGSTFKKITERIFTTPGNLKTIYGEEPFLEKEAWATCRQEVPGIIGGVTVPGGSYFGPKVIPSETREPICLVMPTAGPNYGTSRFSIVRVGSTVKDLVNTIVIGRLESGAEVLPKMFEAREGTIINCGMGTGPASADPLLERLSATANSARVAMLGMALRRPRPSTA